MNCLKITSLGRGRCSANRDSVVFGIAREQGAELTRLALDASAHGLTYLQNRRVVADRIHDAIPLLSAP